MKIALCQINPTVGDFDNNCKKILSFYSNSVDANADIAVFPELSITGYPPQDLLLERSFVDRNVQVLEVLRSAVGNVPMVVGYVHPNGNSLYNSAALLQNGEISGRYDKVLLPTYDVFDEDRYFTPGENRTPLVAKIGSETISLGVEICEDMWDEDYTCKVTDELVEAGAELILNISSSPFNEGKLFERERLIKGHVDRCRVPFLYCNLVGGQDELIFDGNSVAYSSDGRRIAATTSFKEEMVIVDLDSDKKISNDDYSREEELFAALTLGISDYIHKTGHTKCVIGLSGGIDSALTACLAKEALGEENVLCVSMPSRFSTQHSKDDAKELAKNLSVKYCVLSIGEIASVYETAFDSQFDGMARDITEENIQARIRGNFLMAFANKMGYLVLSTGNKTELALGYCTLYGDMSGGLAAISDLNKMDVYGLSKWYNESQSSEVIPGNIFSKKPSAELAEDQVDPFDYEVVSPLVEEIVENHRSKAELVELGYDAKLVENVNHLVRRSEFKRRQAAPGLRVTSKAFGMGRRYPIVNRFMES